MTIQHYTFSQHRHNFAVWTAARAVQRNFTTTGNIKQAIDKSGLREFVDSNTELSGRDFDTQHRIWAYTLQNTFKEKSIPCTYGRAAKIISIYLKTSIIIPGLGSNNISNIIHPPIDGILLRSMSNEQGLSDMKQYRWTQLTEAGYWNLVDRLRKHFGKFDWTLECYWKPELE